MSTTTFEELYQEVAEGRTAEEREQILFDLAQRLAAENASLTRRIESALAAVKPNGNAAPLDLNRLKQLRVEEALQVAGGNRSQAAGLLGVSRRTVQRHLAKQAEAAEETASA